MEPDEMANETQNSKSSPLLPCEFICWELLARCSHQQWQSQHNWHAQLSVGVIDSAVTRVVGGNWLPEHELTVGQPGKDVSLATDFREWLPWDLKEKESLLYLVTEVGDLATDFNKVLKVRYHINKWRKVWEIQYCLVYIQSSPNHLLALCCL